VNPSTVFPWYRTGDNCYVEAKSLTTTRRTLRKRIHNQLAEDSGSPNEPLGEHITIDNCGPVPFLERNYRAPPPPPAVASSEVCTAVTVLSTVTRTVLKPTTIVLRPAPCTTCQPLIFGYTPPITFATEPQPTPMVLVAGNIKSTAGISLPQSSATAPLSLVSSRAPIPMAESSSSVASILMKMQQLNSPLPAVTQKPTQTSNATPNASINNVARTYDLTANIGELSVPLISVVTASISPEAAHPDSLENVSADSCTCTPAVCPREGGKVCFDLQIVCYKVSDANSLFVVASLFASVEYCVYGFMWQYSDGDTCHMGFHDRFDNHPSHYDCTYSDINRLAMMVLSVSPNLSQI
jgi:hypothetical protein